MTDTAVAEPRSQQKMKLDLAQMELTQVVEGLSAVIESTVRGGYLEELSGESEDVRRVIALISVCESQAKRACELSLLCEELQAANPGRL